MASEFETKTFKINDISCMDCVTHIASSVKRLPGTRKVSGNLDQRTVKVQFESDQVSVERIIKAIEAAGYTVDAVEA